MERACQARYPRRKAWAIGSVLDSLLGEAVEVPITTVCGSCVGGSLFGASLGYCLGLVPDEEIFVDAARRWSRRSPLGR